jgi:hypothetical protein
MTNLERWTPTGIDPVDRAVATWRPASMVPAQFKDKDGHVQLADLQLAGMWLYALEVPPVPNLPAVYVIKGRVGIMAELQRALIARAGWDLEVVESTADAATVRIRRAGDRQWKPAVTVTMADAKRAGWTNRKKADVPSNYELIPDRMLAARACTKAISLYAPGALVGIAAPAAHVAELDEESSADMGETAAEGSRLVPPRSVGPSGATIPEHLREPEVDPETRAKLIVRVEALTDEQRDALGAVVHPMKVPNLRSARFTAAHAALLERLVAETEARVLGVDVEMVLFEAMNRARVGAPTVPGPVSVEDPPPPDVPQPGSGHVRVAGDERPPVEVYDNSPEARGYASYASDDPGRPF